MDHSAGSDRPYHHGDLRRVLLDHAERRLAQGGVPAVTLRACARDAGVSPAAALHHFGSLKGLLSALAARGFEGLVDRLDADLKARPDLPRGSLLVGAYVGFAQAAPGLFDLMWRDDLLSPDDPTLTKARADALSRLHEPGASTVGAIRTWSLAHGLATLLRHGRIVTALGGPQAGLTAVEDFVALAYSPAFSGR